MLAEQAKGYFEEGKKAIAADLFHKAFAADPEPGYLYSAARAEHRGGNLESAIQHYKKVLTLPRKGSAFFANPQAAIKVDIYLKAAQQELERKGAGPSGPAPPPPAASQPKAEGPAPRPPTPPTKRITPAVRPPTAPTTPRISNSDEKPAIVRATAPGDDQWKRPAGMVALIAGAAGVFGGGILAIVAAGDQSDLDAFRVNPDDLDSKFDSKQITVDEARTRQQAVNDRITLAWIAGGAGVVLAGAGAWLFASSDAATAVRLTPRGLRVGWRF